MNRLISKILCIVGFTTFAFAAQATTLDLTALPDGPYTGNADVTFSLSGVGESGNPTIGGTYGGGLWNSTDGPTYPTNTQIQAVFAGTVTNVSWMFNNQGGKTTTYTVYDASNAIVASGFNSTFSGFQNVNLGPLELSRIVWDNGGNNWLFNLGEISYEYAAPVPVPAGLPLLATCLFGLGILRRRAKSA